MTRPTRREDSSAFQFKRRTPRALLAHKGSALTFLFPDDRSGAVEVSTTIGDVIKFSLRTREPDVAKLRCALANSQIERLAEAATPELFPLFKERLIALGEKTVDGRLPEKSNSAPAATRVSILALADCWGTEAEKLRKSPSTIDGFKRVIRRFVAFLRHDDGNRVTDVDVIKFKDHRLHVDGCDPKTVAHADLVAIKSVFKWAVDNKQVSGNPAQSVALAVPRKPKQKGYSEEAARTLLRACLSHAPMPGEAPTTAAAKKWAFLIAAYTGARIGEIIQLRRDDVCQLPNGVWVMHVRPEAGRIKDIDEREVPLHPQIVQLGLPEFVRCAPPGYLFITARDGSDYRGSWKGVKNRMGELARSIVREDRVTACHGWRHHFITRCRKHGVDAEKRRMITGHAGRGIDEESYGDVAGLYEEILKLPSYDLSPTSANPRSLDK